LRTPIGSSRAIALLDGLDAELERDADVDALASALEKISAHARPLRPGRIR
jgi:hypothetical protein